MRNSVSSCSVFYIAENDGDHTPNEDTNPKGPEYLYREYLPEPYSGNSKYRNPTVYYMGGCQNYGPFLGP